MKKYHLSILFLFFTLFLKSQNFEFPKLYSYSIGIKGTTLMVDKGAATVSDWFTYAYNTLQNHSPDTIRDVLDTSQYYQFPKKMIDSLMPDTNVLPEKYHFMVRMFYRLVSHPTDDKEYSVEPFEGDNVFNIPGFVIIGHSDRLFYLPISKEEKKVKLRDSILIYYLQLPIVGVSFTQVQGYLKWRLQLENNSKPLKKSKSKGCYLKDARMFTQEEWLRYAPEFGPRSAGNHNSLIDTMDNDTCRCYLLNIIGGNPGKMYGTGSVPVYSYWADSLGLFNMYGNVAEMTNDNGIAVGASYLDYGSACKSERIIPYSKPQPWLGFRCVLEFEKK